MQNPADTLLRGVFTVSRINYQREWLFFNDNAKAPVWD